MSEEKVRISEHDDCITRLFEQHMTGVVCQEISLSRSKQQ